MVSFRIEISYANMKIVLYMDIVLVSVQLLFDQFISHIIARSSYNPWDDNDIHFSLEQHALLEFYGVSSLKQESTTCRYTRTHYLDSHPTSLGCYSWMLIAGNSVVSFTNKIYRLDIREVFLIKLCCCLTSSVQFFSYFQDGNKLILLEVAFNNYNHISYNKYCYSNNRNLWIVMKAGGLAL